MKAEIKVIEKIFAQSCQFKLPLFQRNYVWKKQNFQTLWNDILDTYKINKVDIEFENNLNYKHFLGTIVLVEDDSLAPTMEQSSNNEAFIVIDGQQRLITLQILLRCLSLYPEKFQNEVLAEKIRSHHLINGFEEGWNKYKILPNTDDRETFRLIMDNSSEPLEKNLLTDAFDFLNKKVAKVPIKLDHIYKVVAKCFTIAEITLQHSENPYAVFESLNNKGLSLTQADLIKNYYFMNISQKDQDFHYKFYWEKIERRITEAYEKVPIQHKIDPLTEFFRHSLILSKNWIGKNDVYLTLKEVEDKNLYESKQEASDKSHNFLEKYLTYSKFYERILDTDKESNSIIRNHLRALNRMDFTTAYPLLLKLYLLFDENKISEDQFIKILGLLENYIVRVSLNGSRSKNLNKVFPALVQKFNGDFNDPVLLIMERFNEHYYPTDEELIENLKNYPTYASGERARKTKFILEVLETSFGHKEVVSFDKLQIEHILPQKLNDDWKTVLGDYFDETHKHYKNLLGNLTLTGMNSEMSNKPFDYKKKIYLTSHLELNKYFADLEEWTPEEIDLRTESLANEIISIWPYKGPENRKERIKRVTSSNQNGKRTKPRRLIYGDKEWTIKNWNQVPEIIVEEIIASGDGNFEKLLANFPQYFTTDAYLKKSGQTYSELSNGYFMNRNFSGNVTEERVREYLSAISWDPDLLVIEREELN